MSKQQLNTARTDIDPCNVQKNMCKTCPFRVQDERLMQKISSYICTESNHICHSTNNSICRGSRDIQLQVFHRLGAIKEPTDEAWEYACKQHSRQ